jgi:hypothetical protein
VSFLKGIMVQGKQLFSIREPTLWLGIQKRQRTRSKKI